MDAVDDQTSFEFCYAPHVPQHVVLSLLNWTVESKIIIPSHLPKTVFTYLD